ncbi:MAG: hypothetical protein AB1540_08025 [Bdellovibrionota bacterium]
MDLNRGKFAWLFIVIFVFSNEWAHSGLSVRTSLGKNPRASDIKANLRTLFSQRSTCPNGATPISFMAIDQALRQGHPYAINAPGSYCLLGDMNFDMQLYAPFFRANMVPLIEVAADDVEIDLQGSSIRAQAGPKLFSAAFRLVSHRQNIKIRNSDPESGGLFGFVHGIENHPTRFTEPPLPPHRVCSGKTINGLEVAGLAIGEHRTDLTEATGVRVECLKDGKILGNTIKTRHGLSLEGRKFDHSGPSNLLVEENSIYITRYASDPGHRFIGIGIRCFREAHIKKNTVQFTDRIATETSLFFPQSGIEAACDHKSRIEDNVLLNVGSPEKRAGIRIREESLETKIFSNEVIGTDDRYLLYVDRRTPREGVAVQAEDSTELEIESNFLALVHYGIRFDSDSSLAEPVAQVFWNTPCEVRRASDPNGSNLPAPSARGWVHCQPQ